jgi:hypothetical protein
MGKKPFMNYGSVDGSGNGICGKMGYMKELVFEL